MPVGLGPRRVVVAVSPSRASISQPIRPPRLVVITVVVGHLQCDDDKSIEDCTSFIVNRYSKDCPVVLAPGRTQIERRFDHWEEDLKKVSVLKMNLREARRLLRLPSEDRISLAKIIDRLQSSHITTLITFGKFGAIGTFKNEESVTITSSMLSFQVKDTTGAGDAFAAGMAAKLIGKTVIAIPDFVAAIGEGRTWAAYSCQQEGASRECPSMPILDNFRKQHGLDRYSPVPIVDSDQRRHLLDLIDYAFDTGDA